MSRQRQRSTRPRVTTRSATSGIPGRRSHATAARCTYRWNGSRTGLHGPRSIDWQRQSNRSTRRTIRFRSGSTRSAVPDAALRPEVGPGGVRRTGWQFGSASLLDANSARRSETATAVVPRRSPSGVSSSEEPRRRGSSHVAGRVLASVATTDGGPRQHPARTPRPAGGVAGRRCAAARRQQAAGRPGSPGAGARAGGDDATR